MAHLGQGDTNVVTERGRPTPPVASEARTWRLRHQASPARMGAAWLAVKTAPMGLQPPSPPARTPPTLAREAFALCRNAARTREGSP